MPSTLPNRMKMKSVKMNGKYFLPCVADIVAHHVGDELVAQLGDRLQAARHQRPLAHAITNTPSPGSRR